MYVPVELCGEGRGRWFRLATTVSADALCFLHVIPEELEGPVRVAFHLPGDAAPVRCRGRVVTEVVGEGEEERQERRAVAFLEVEEEARARITHYVNERLGLS
jgi:hypothetical protein